MKKNIKKRVLTKKQIIISTLILAVLLSVGAIVGLNTFAASTGRLTISILNYGSGPIAQGRLTKAGTTTGLANQTVYTYVYLNGSKVRTVTSKTNSSGNYKTPYLCNSATHCDGATTKTVRSFWGGSRYYNPVWSTTVTMY